MISILKTYPLTLLTVAVICYLSFFTPPQTEFDNISKNILPISNIISSVRRWSLAVQDAVVNWDDEHWHKVLMQTLRSTPGFSQALRTYRYGDKVLSQW